MYSNLHTPAKAARGYHCMHCSPLLHVSNFILQSRVTAERLTQWGWNECTRWISGYFRKLSPWLAKLLGLRQTPLTTWDLLTPGHRECSSIRVCAPWQGDCLSSHTKEWNRGMVYNVLDGSPYSICYRQPVRSLNIGSSLTDVHVYHHSCKLLNKSNISRNIPYMHMIHITKSMGKHILVHLQA